MKSRKRKFLSPLSMAIAAALAIPCMPINAFNANAIGESLCINEICAKNSTHTAPDGQCYDWIEIYNSGSSAVDLSGFGLSDKETELFKFTFPAGSSIGAGQRLIVY